jgi:hypothetical protein
MGNGREIGGPLSWFAGRRMGRDFFALGRHASADRASALEMKKKPRFAAV